VLKGAIMMKYYSNWQDALQDFIRMYGHNYLDPYNLMVEFEEQLKRNIKGVYFMYVREDK
jgi:hypothetical protein